MFVCVIPLKLTLTSFSTPSILIYSASSLVFFIPHIAPSGPPLNFTALSISPSSILLSWEAPTITQQNGLIRSFSILLTDLLTLRQSVHSVDSHHSQKIIDMLHPHRLFECAVAAVTVEIGVYSPSVIVQTQDDGEQKYTMHTLISFLLFMQFLLDHPLQ